MRLSSSGRIMSFVSKSASSSSKSSSRSNNSSWNDPSKFRETFEDGQVLAIGLGFSITNVVAGVKHTVVIMRVRSKQIGWTLDMQPSFEFEVFVVFEFNKDGREFHCYNTPQEAVQDRSFVLLGLHELSPPVPINPMLALCNDMPMYDLLEFNCRDACKKLLHHFNVFSFDSEIVLVSEVIGDFLGEE